MLPSKWEFNHIASPFWLFSLNTNYILIYKEISEPFPKHLFHYSSILIFSPTLYNTDIDIWQEKGDETHRGNSIFMLVILKNQSVLSFCNVTFLWQNIKSNGGSLKKMVSGSLKSGVMFTMSELDTWEEIFTMV